MSLLCPPTIEQLDDADRWAAARHQDAKAAFGLSFRGRAAIVLVLFGLAFVTVLARLVQLEATSGEEYRQLARQPLRSEEPLPAVRGRILARDGTVLAHDKPAAALAMHFRYLELPADEAWLRRQARSRLPRADRNSPEKVAAAVADLSAELEALHERLALLCRLSPETWEARRRRITRQVRSMADSVNQRRRERLAESQQQPPNNASWLEQLWYKVQAKLSPQSADPPPIVIAEELQYHVLADDLPLDAAATIEGSPESFPGVRVISSTHRDYPLGPVASHILGYLGQADEPSTEAERELAAAGIPLLVGKQGIEAAYNDQLRGKPGLEVRLANRSGEVLQRQVTQQPQPGRDVVLTLDAALQQTVDQLLVAAVERNRALSGDEVLQKSGGAVVVLDVHTGAILAAASAPAFDPNLFLRADLADVQPLLTAPDFPLLNRVAQMAIPPGSVFKPVTAAAALERGVVEAEERFYCQGFLSHEGSHRCAIFVTRGIGHGDVALPAAMAQSCNVYFFRLAQRVGPDALFRWGTALGYGGRTGIDLPGEVAGNLPDIPAELARGAWSDGDTLQLAIGQGYLTASPLQVAVMTAAVANGGYRVTPHVVERVGLANRLTDMTEDVVSQSQHTPVPIAGLQPQTLSALRQGMEAAVADQHGTAHAALAQLPIAVAGKTGTAETGGNRPPHAWFAGYAPAERPRYAVVAVLEHGGSGGSVAALLAARVLARMDQLGYFAQ